MYIYIIYVDTYFFILYILYTCLTFRESGLVGSGIRLRIGSIPVQTPVDTQPGLGTQPHHEAPGDAQAEQVPISSD